MGPGRPDVERAEPDGAGEIVVRSAGLRGHRQGARYGHRRPRGATQPGGATVAAGRLRNAGAVAVRPRPAAGGARGLHRAAEGGPLLRADRPAVAAHRDALRRGREDHRDAADGIDHAAQRRGDARRRQDPDERDASNRRRGSHDRRVAHRLQDGVGHAQSGGRRRVRNGAASGARTRVVGVHVRHVAARRRDRRRRHPPGRDADGPATRRLRRTGRQSRRARVPVVERAGRD